MGWMTLCRPLSPPVSEKIAAHSEHTEDITELSNTSSLHATQSSLCQKYARQDPSVLDSELPYIDPSVLSLVEQEWASTATTTNPSNSVFRTQPPPPAWIVIDDIIYDCTDFQTKHPGGSIVIRRFVGQDCSWQFWRFHSKQLMQAYGKALRVGRTNGIKNRFKEPPKYVGLTSLGDDW
ncbi:cytochrome b5-like heme/steroid binding domain-containing protein [Aspergillus californicus]